MGDLDGQPRTARPITRSCATRTGSATRDWTRAISSINSAAAVQLSFRNNYDTEYDPPPAEVFWDGYVLEVSTDGGGTLERHRSRPGEAFVSGAYTGEIDGTANNPLAGRMAWCGDSGGYINTVINLPASFNGQTIKLRSGWERTKRWRRRGARTARTGASCHHADAKSCPLSPSGERQTRLIFRESAPLRRGADRRDRYPVCAIASRCVAGRRACLTPTSGVPRLPSTLHFRHVRATREVLSLSTLTLHFCHDLQKKIAADSVPR